ncbi:MAG: hypothetical protein PHU27_05515 [Salinivirgaceae bacterium]|nr:hypothetical protein [Salinivirgaceae bacterium]MDD4747927.1 hypothetical protein [Salinivirgaceae bacterium]
MKRLIQFITIATLAYGMAGCAAKKELMITYGSNHNIESQIISVGKDGTKMIKAWAFAKNPELAFMYAKRNAVSAAIFKGFPAGGGSGMVGAIVRNPNADTEHKAFFDEFFKDDGKWAQYVVSKNVGMPSGNDRLKVGKGYKVGASVAVKFDALRKYLEDSNIAKKLDEGF